MKSNFIILSFLAFLATVVLSANGSDQVDPEVDLPQGKIRGFIKKSREGRDYFAFHLVPFAQAGRFELPREAEKWDHVLNATGIDQGCAQTAWVSNETMGREDCLQLYIHTPQLSGKRPVMVFLHGGGFTIGTAAWFTGGYLVDEDVVFVAPNYRLGPFGFLSTGDEVIPGNLGLKDQVMALKWVQKNIEKFGGDPERVTIFGLSAGGAAVNYHLISPMSSGLFKYAISMSGSALNPWAFSWNPRAMAEKYAHNLGCPAQDSKDMLACLKEKPLQEMLDALPSLTEWGYDPFTPFGAVIETGGEGERFLSELPETAMREGRFTKVPWIIGIAEDEGIMMHSGYVLGNERLMRDFRDGWRRIFPITFEYNEVYTNLSESDQKRVSVKISDYYFGGRFIDESAFQELTDVYSDRLFNNGVKKAVMLAGHFTPMYTYEFAEPRRDYSSLNLIGSPGVYGVGHADDLSFIFSEFHTAPPFEKGSAKETVSKNYVKLFTSFAKEGKPTATYGAQREWNPVSKEELSRETPLKFYKIAQETSLVDEHFAERYKFWEDLFSQFPYSSIKDEL